MKAMKLTLAVAIVLVSTSPAFSHFVKAALGFRLGYSPTEQKGPSASEKKGVGVQAVTGINNGGWQGGGGGMQAAGSGYGVSGGRSLGGGPLDAHNGHSAVKHLRILGLNLYLGGRAVNGLANGIGHKPPLLHKPIYNLVQPHNNYVQHQPQNFLHTLVKPVSLGASVGGGVKPIQSHAPNGGKIIGGQSGVRAAVGLPNFGLGFNLGYKQGINTKSPFGHLFGLAGPLGGGKYYHAPIHHKGPVFKGQDQVIFPGGGVMKGHGHDVSHSPPVAGGQSPFFGGFPQGFENSGLESKQQFNTQPLPAASNAQPQQQQQQQASQQPQASHYQPQQQAHGPPKHQGLQGPLAFASSYPRNPFLALFSRPSILRPTSLHYNFNSPKPLSSGPVRMVLSPHHQHASAPQRQHGPPSGPQGWSTLFPVGAQSAPNNPFVNPIPPNGHPLVKYHATLRPGNPFHPQSAPVTSAQNQVPFLHQLRAQQQQQHQQPQQGFQGFFPQALQGQPQFGNQPGPQHPQNNFQQFFSSGFQQQQASGAPQIGQEFNPFQQSGFQNFQIPQANFQQGHLIPQQSPSPFFSQIQEQPVQAATPAAAQAKQSQPAANNLGLPFNPEAVPFAPEAGFQYSHSTVSQPIKMGDFTTHMDMTNNLNANSAEQNGAGSELPLFGPMGRRLKKTKKTRQDSIVKKQGSAVENISKQQDMMETSASTHSIANTNINNAITLASSLGATSWTPIVFEDIPRLQKKTLGPKETKQVSASVQVVDKKGSQSPPVVGGPTGGSSFFTGPSASPDKQDRTRILRRRLHLSSAEMLNTAATTIPAMTSSVSSSSVTPSASSPSSPSSTSTTTTTTTTTSAPPSSSSSNSPSTSPSSTSQTSPAPVTTTTVVSA